MTKFVFGDYEKLQLAVLGGAASLAVGFLYLTEPAAKRDYEARVDACQQAGGVMLVETSQCVRPNIAGDVDVVALQKAYVEKPAMP